MAPKNAKAVKTKQKPQDEQREDSLQAVVSGTTGLWLIAHIDTTQVLADSFETRFKPFTLERPRVRLCPTA